MLKILAILVVILVAAVLIHAATKTDAFRVERSVTIEAPAEEIFTPINDFHRWGEWSPYEKLDPAMRRTLSGTDSGTGAMYAWESDGKAGAGRMLITESMPYSLIVIQLDFSKPFKASHVAEFSLRPEGDATRVTWSMRGSMPYISKLFSVFVDMDTMIGKDFEAGLASLKSLTEK